MKTLVKEPKFVKRLSLSYGTFDAFYMPPLEAQQAFDACSARGGRLPRFMNEEDFEKVGSLHVETGAFLLG